jgi:signal peptidase I
MPAGTAHTHRIPVDMRITAYRVLGYLAVIAAAGFCFKYFIFDSITVKTNQMSPAICNGDRILISKIRRLPPVSWPLPFPGHSVVIFRQSIPSSGPGCLRIAGRWGDVVSISNGKLSLLNKPLVSPLGRMDSRNALPQEYSPRDWLDTYVIPKKGDRFNLDSMKLRDIIFAWAVIRQENKPGRFTLKPWLSVGDSLLQDYYITDFALYRGPFNAIGPELSTQWFFWDKLVNYIQATNPDREISLKLSILFDNAVVTDYKVKRNYCFLAADNWEEGFDSRFFGPVKYDAIQGGSVCVLWSFDPQKKGLPGLRADRICRITGRKQKHSEKPDESLK